MDKLESQIAKIELSYTKTANNYVFVIAEKAAGSESELYMTAELPLLNPAAAEQCEKICLAVASAFRRVFKRPIEDSSFENAIASINEELGKLAQMGQNYWVNKFNCVLAVKYGTNFMLATCGKTAAYLLRDGQLADIGANSGESHPLKTFDSFATGKIRLGDMLILSNAQLLNFLSLDRVKEIFKKHSFLSASQTIIEILRQNAGTSVAFGTIFNLQVTAGEANENAIDLENYSVKTPLLKVWAEKVTAFFKNLAGINPLKRQSGAQLPQISVSERLGNLKGTGNKLLHQATGMMGDFTSKIKNAGKTVSPAKIKQFSPAKKYLLVATLVFFVAAGLSVAAAIYNKNVVQKKQALAAKLKNVSDQLNLAESSLLYKDESQAFNNYKNAAAAMPAENEIPEAQKSDYESMVQKLSAFRGQLEHEKQVEVTSLGSLGGSERLISLPEYLAVQVGKNLVSYEKATGKIEDGRLKLNSTMLAAYSFKNGQAAIYDSEALSIWNYEAGTQGPTIISSVPPKERFVGLAYYPTNNRIYLIDKQKNQIISFLINKDRLQNPVVSITDAGFSQAEDLTIDGNIYVLSPAGILKFTAGKAVDFTTAFLFEPYEGNGRLETKVGWEFLYLLDRKQNRIIVLDKKGKLQTTLVSEKFTELKDFTVDETQKTIYLLNGTELLKVNY